MCEEHDLLSEGKKKTSSARTSRRVSSGNFQLSKRRTCGRVHYQLVFPKIGVGSIFELWNRVLIAASFLIHWLGFVSQSDLIPTT